MPHDIFLTVSTERGNIKIIHADGRELSIAFDRNPHKYGPVATAVHAREARIFPDKDAAYATSIMDHFGDDDALGIVTLMATFLGYALVPMEPAQEAESSVETLGRRGSVSWE